MHALLRFHDSIFFGRLTCNIRCIGALSWSGWLGTMGGKACFISRVFYSLKHFSKFENFVCFSVLSYAQNIDLLENKIDGVHRGVQNIG